MRVAEVVAATGTEKGSGGGEVLRECAEHQYL